MSRGKHYAADRRRKARRPERYRPLSGERRGGAGRPVVECHLTLDGTRACAYATVLDCIREPNTMVCRDPESNMGNAAGCSPVLKLYETGIPIGLGAGAYTHDMLESLKVLLPMQRHNACDPNADWGEAVLTMLRKVMRSRGTDSEVAQRGRRTGGPGPLRPDAAGREHAGNGRLRGDPDRAGAGLPVGDVTGSGGGRYGSAPFRRGWNGGGLDAVGANGRFGPRKIGARQEEETVRSPPPFPSSGRFV